MSTDRHGFTYDPSSLTEAEHTLLAIASLIEDTEQVERFEVVFSLWQAQHRRSGPMVPDDLVEAIRSRVKAGETLRASMKAFADHGV